MSKPSLHRHPSLDGSSSVGDVLRPSLFDTKDDFIDRISPVAVAAIYFGSFSLAPQDTSLSRQALYKLSFLYRHFLQPAGLQIAVDKQTAILSGTVSSHLLVEMAELLARQIEGIKTVKNETVTRAEETAGPREIIQFLFATDQTLRSSVKVDVQDGRLTLAGTVTSAAQKSWAEQVATTIAGHVDSKLELLVFTPPPHLKSNEPPILDDESLQALVLFRLHLNRETEHLPVKIKATRGVITLHGKVRNEAQRQRVENLTRATLGARELRSSLSIAAA